MGAHVRRKEPEQKEKTTISKKKKRAKRRTTPPSHQYNHSKMEAKEKTTTRASLKVGKEIRPGKGAEGGNNERQNKKEG